MMRTRRKSNKGHKSTTNGVGVGRPSGAVGAQPSVAVVQPSVSRKAAPPKAADGEDIFILPRPGDSVTLHDPVAVENFLKALEEEATARVGNVSPEAVDQEMVKIFLDVMMQQGSKLNVDAEGEGPPRKKQKLDDAVLTQSVDDSDPEKPVEKPMHVRKIVCKYAPPVQLLLTIV